MLYWNTNYKLEILPVFQFTLVAYWNLKKLISQIQYLIYEPVSHWATVVAAICILVLKGAKHQQRQIYYVS
jgi:hypothetical protein